MSENRKAKLGILGTIGGLSLAMGFLFVSPVIAAILVGLLLLLVRLNGKEGESNRSVFEGLFVAGLLVTAAYEIWRPLFLIGLVLLASGASPQIAGGAGKITEAARRVGRYLVKSYREISQE
jgi:hypothetical protein